MTGSLSENLKTAILAGILGGALAGFIEALIRAVLLDFYRPSLFASGLFYYAIIGLVVGVILSIISSIIIGFFKRNVRYLDLLYFAATFTCLIWPVFSRLVVKRFIVAIPDSPVGVIYITAIIYAFFFLALVLILVFGKLASARGIKRLFAGLICYLMTLIILLLLINYKTIRQR